ncbi:unnamed protein product [Urochloa humidicola]
MPSRRRVAAGSRCGMSAAPTWPSLLSMRHARGAYMARSRPLRRPRGRMAAGQSASWRHVRLAAGVGRGAGSSARPRALDAAQARPVDPAVLFSASPSPPCFKASYHLLMECELAAGCSHRSLLLYTSFVLA